LGLLCGFGRIIEKHCQQSISALEYFASTDAHAEQYALIAKSLLSTALEYLDKRESQERLRRTETSAQLFGLLPSSSTTAAAVATGTTMMRASGSELLGNQVVQTTTMMPATGGPDQNTIGKPLDPSLPPQFTLDIDSAFLDLDDALPTNADLALLSGSLDTNSDDAFGALNLFPLLDSGGHIDLAHYF
jgi:hypothetical protein